MAYIGQSNGTDYYGSPSSEPGCASTSIRVYDKPSIRVVKGSK